MCESVAEGGRRCADYRRLAALSASQIAPALRDGVPAVSWADADLSPLWSGSRGPDHQALAAAVDRLREVRAVEPEITDALLGALPAGTCLHGLAERVKSPASTAAKVARKRRGDESPRAVVARFTDTLRYTLLVDEHEQIVPAARQTLTNLSGQGMAVVEASETYRPGASYKGVHFLVRVQAPEGTTFELQVHSVLSQRVKDAAHVHYERARDPDSSDADVAAATSACIELSEGVPTPPGLEQWDEVAGCRIQHL